MHLDTPCIYVCIFICAYTYICIHRYIVYTHVCVCVCVFVCGCVHVYVHTYRQQRRSLLHKSLAQTLGRFWKRALHKSWVDFAKEPYTKARCLLQKSPTQQPGTVWNRALHKTGLFCRRALRNRALGKSQESFAIKPYTKQGSFAKEPYAKVRSLRP